MMMMLRPFIVALLIPASSYIHAFRNVRSLSLSRSFLSLGQHIENIVTEVDSKTRLDSYLASTFPDRSRSFFGTLCDESLVYVNEKIQSKSYKVKKGDRIVFNMEETATTSVAPEYIPLNILYEDNDIIAVNKPNGMVVHPAVGSPNGTFVNALLHHIGEQAAQALLQATPSAVINTTEDNEDIDIDANEGGLTFDLPETPEAAKATPLSLRPGIVHRLDKGTTGLLLAGKHPMAVEKLSKLFAQREVSKTYLAVCIGHPGELTIADPIGRSFKNRQIMCIYDGPPGKPAITHTRTICFDGKLSVVLVRIETGRTHQIRVHLKSSRTPILGDETYGQGQWNRRYLKSHQIQRPLLHAYETRFSHPFTGEEMVLQAPLPADMMTLVKAIAGGNIQPGMPSDMLSQLVDPESGLLTISTEVEGRFGGRGSTVTVEGGTPVIAAATTSSKGYVPSERILLEEEDWTSIELPEDPEYFK